MRHHKFGLIGRNIQYSFSKKFYEQKFLELGLPDHSYEIFDLKNIEEVEKIFEDPELAGLNVTVPYKEKILPYLDELSDEAAAIGAVNCIEIRDKVRTGHNTDVYGFQKTLDSHRKAFQQSALILGNGGAAKAVAYAFKKNNIPCQFVSRGGALNFENLSHELVRDHLIIVQCTPVGTHPNVSDSVEFPFEALSGRHLVIDLIYNPPQTAFLKNAEKAGANAVNGALMLEQQAEKNWEIWHF